MAQVLKDPNSIVKEAVKEAFKELEDIDTDGYNKVEKDKTALKEATDDATIAAQEEVNQCAIHEFGKLDLIPEAELADFVSQALSKRLPSNRIEMIAKGLQVVTYRLNFRQEDGVYFADITKGGEKFMDSIRLATAEDFETATALQIASIVVEAIFLLMSLIGIIVPEKVVADVAQKLSKTILQSKPVVAAANALKRAWGSAGASSNSKAKALWEFIKKLWEYHTEGKIFWTVVKGLCQNMGWFDWAKTILIITATIVAAVFSGGAAMVAKIILAVISAYEFSKKIANLNELDEIRLMVGV